MRTYLDFEKPIAELESKVAELKAVAGQEHSVAMG
ncbi:MAG: acetyl-CoA carboxylase carboxyl transferase subunit alpha, partial [Methyloceanibacter sp.]